MCSEPEVGRNTRKMTEETRTKEQKVKGNAQGKRAMFEKRIG